MTNASAMTLVLAVFATLFSGAVLVILVGGAWSQHGSARRHHRHEMAPHQHAA